jgi:superfamily I DNA/RNA helicase
MPGSFSKGIPGVPARYCSMPLNPSQETAVKTCGFQLILAGPGSGKTRVITEKILHLIDQGVPPNQILALTFSDKAASEMSNRIEEKRPHLDLNIHTFHSFCLDILKENVLASGIPSRAGSSAEPRSWSGACGTSMRSGLSTSRWGTTRRR